MKIVKILGGLGNQMFQYALYLALKKQFPNERVAIDISCFNGYPLHNGFEIDNIFSLNSDIATWKEVAKLAYPYPNYRCWQIGKHLLPKRKTMCIEKNSLMFDDTVLSQPGDRYYDGYWQHEKYFSFAKEQIYSAFIFPPPEDVRNRELMAHVTTSNSVAVHIRRGDYVNHPYFKGICDVDYYKRAIAYMEEFINPELYCVFSNDIAWCKDELGDSLPKNNTIYVNWNNGHKSYIDMQIMSNCKHIIIANSSFSWWGAWLNQNKHKVVVAPSKWNNIKQAKYPVPASWIKI